MDSDMAIRYIYLLGENIVHDSAAQLKARRPRDTSEARGSGWNPNAEIAVMWYSSGL